MSEILEGIAVSILGILFVIAVVFVFDEGLKKTEINECHKWIKMSTEYKDFYLTKAEAAQCENYNIKINAPIK